MTRTKMTTAVVFVLVGLAATGCNNKHEAAIEVLENDYQDLLDQNRGLQEQLVAAKSEQSNLKKKAATADQAVLNAHTALNKAREQIESLKSTSASGSPVKPVQGWEAGLYGVRTTVGSDVLFSSGRATLTAPGKAAISRIAGDIKTTYAGMPVRVYGYTDNEPIAKTRKLWKDNLDLSANRAMAVTRYLISKGVPARRIETVAVGDSRYNTSLGKARNRRVEIVVIRQ